MRVGHFTALYSLPVLLLADVTENVVVLLAARGGASWLQYAIGIFGAAKLAALFTFIWYLLRLLLRR